MSNEIFAMLTKYGFDSAIHASIKEIIDILMENSSVDLDDIDEYECYICGLSEKTNRTYEACKSFTE